MTLLTVKDASERLGIACSTLRYHTDLGHIKAMRTSEGDRHYTPSDIAKFAKWRARRAGTPAPFIARAIAQESATER